MDIKLISILAAALAVSIGSIGPALAEGRSVAAAMDAIARQPEAAGHDLAHALRRPRDDRDDGDLLPRDRPAAALRQSLCRVTMHFDWSTFALQTVNFAILVWLLHRFLYRPVLRLIDARRAEIDKQYADARGAETKAKDQLAAVAAERAGIAAERAAALAAGGRSGRRSGSSAARPSGTRRSGTSRRCAQDPCHGARPGAGRGADGPRSISAAEHRRPAARRSADEAARRGVA